MTVRTRPAALLALAALLASTASAVPAYKGFIVTDAANGAVLFESNADAMSPPASMTKLMTFAVLDDEIRRGGIALDTPITATAEAARVGEMKDSTAVRLKRGETFTVDELVYAMMLQSANDAAYAVAQRVGGTVPAFVARMNAKARELGMTRSTFHSPNGFPPPGHRLSDTDMTTPRDYAVLCRYLLLHTDILRYTSVKTRPFGAGVRAEPLLMSNHNHLLGAVRGVDGLKTGFTGNAGFCLSATAERNGHRIIVVMMDSPDHKTRDLNVIRLIEEAYMKFPVTEPPFSKAGAAAPSVPLAVPVAPTRPTAEAPASDGPVIHMPGTSGT